MAVEVGVQKMRKKLEELLKERLKADRVSVECEGPEEDRRLMLTVVSPQFRGLTKVEDRDSLIWDDQVHGIKHMRLRAWTPEDDQLHSLHRQAPAFFADNK
ncbi:uncharacterized protein ACA1_023380 [Acanthamoeba castellanii str. Neff]|uniref:Uncharacterized protein n=1 Tax=Acanthamoeba castellanii (strain ATCC 30010 / Neff) TaxID=1257118 RepID=L8GUZ9_ACACF|nr:uncharacterized protein ACA1_023380 [Acanthamoeba castellanii str. Neff]ELR15926.1 hypothetical protein ACA1_023380 [Acanthamoeba castellanii str. Neff]